jgi:hypothetical protein
MVKTGRPAWDSTVMKPCPPALRGCKPITPEPWARDMAVYESGMTSHGYKDIDTGVETTYAAKSGIQSRKSVRINNPAQKIQHDMIAYRKELGQGGKAPVSARHLRAWSDAGLIPSTPKSGRYTGRSARSSARAGSPEPAAMSPAAAERAARIKAKSSPKDEK